VRTAGPIVAAVALAALAACGDGDTTDCACTVTIDPTSITLGCGDEGCLGGMLFGCDEDNVLVLGSCGPMDMTSTDGGACLAAGMMCDPAGAATCCAVPVDAGALHPSCDPETRHCCVPVGGGCSDTADCCSGHVCMDVSGVLQCS